MTFMQYQKIIKHGNAKAVVIPAAVCRELYIHLGDVVKLTTLSKAKYGSAGVVLYLEIVPVIDADGSEQVRYHG